MINGMCLVCNDIKHFNMKVYDTERIQKYLSHYAEPIAEKEDLQLWQNLSMPQQHQHFMCGHCYKVDGMQLRRSEQMLAETVYGICKKIEQGEEIPVHEVLRTLQGYFPIMYKCVETSYHKKK